KRNKSLYYSVQRVHKSSGHFKSTFLSIGLTILYTISYILSFIVGILFPFLVSLILHAWNPLSWYSRVWFAPLLYGFPSLLGILLVEWICNIIARNVFFRYKSDFMKTATRGRQHYFDRERFFAVLYTFA